MSVLFAICNHCCSFVIRLSRHFLTRKKISCITPLWILLFKILIPIYMLQNYYGILCSNSATKVVTDVARLLWLQTNTYRMTGLHKLASLLKKMDTPRSAKVYSKCLIKMMPSIDRVQYPKTSTFSCNQLVAITAEQVATFLNKRAFGIPVPDPDDHPHAMRASSLAFFKKAISQFMPLRSMPLDDINLRGNPTRSTAVNEVISKVKNLR